jgi:acetyl esterase/lipase
MAESDPKNTLRYSTGALDDEGLSKEWLDVIHQVDCSIFADLLSQWEKLLGVRPMAELSGKSMAELRQLARKANLARNAGYLKRNSDLRDAVAVEDSAFVAEDITISLRIYRPRGADAPTPCAVFYHGGGWIIGSVDEDDIFCRMIVRDLGHVVISVEYRLAPESPFPIPVDDCYKSLLWVTAFKTREMVQEC